MEGMGRRSRTGSSFPDNSLVCRMMLQFRPIAPKPVNGQAVAADILPEKTNGSNGRVKRKYARLRRNKQYYCKKKKSTRSTSSSSVEPSIINQQQRSTNKSLVTLELLPKRSDDEDLIKNKEIWCNFGNHRIPGFELLMQGKENEDNRTNNDSVNDDQKKVVVRRSIVMETWVIVERVVTTGTNTCTDHGIGLGFSDVDKMNNLELDPSPGFVSEFSGKVHWVNEAYKKLVSGADGEEVPTEFGVRLVTKQELPYSCPLFGCTVRFEYALGGRKCSRIVPCDVWRMDFGGFAWKLDIKASLSLGLQH